MAEKKIVAARRSSPDKPKRLPLPKRFNVALTEAAYANLRELNQQWGLGNNYLLVVLLERLSDITDKAVMDRVFKEFIEEYSAPKPKDRPSAG